MVFFRNTGWFFSKIPDGFFLWSDGFFFRTRMVFFSRTRMVFFQNTDGFFSEHGWFFLRTRMVFFQNTDGFFLEHGWFFSRTGGVDDNISPCSRVKIRYVFAALVACREELIFIKNQFFSKNSPKSI